MRSREAISEETREWNSAGPEDSRSDLNRMMIGWANYFCLGPVSTAYRAVERHAVKGYDSGSRLAFLTKGVEKDSTIQLVFSHGYT